MHQLPWGSLSSSAQSASCFGTTGRAEANTAQDLLDSQLRVAAPGMAIATSIRSGGPSHTCAVHETFTSYGPRLTNPLWTTNLPHPIPKRASNASLVLRLCVKILLIEDDVETAAFICEGLGREGHNVEVSGDGEAAMARASASGWDVLIVDRMLPKRDGLTVIRDLREGRFAQPILILSALDALDDRVTGLNAGADDYLVKPFALVELAARVNALGRRRQSDNPETRFKLGDLEMDLLSRRVARAGREIQLQHREFELLEFLLQHMGQVVTRKMLLEHVWKYSFDPKTNVVESHISRLRAKVDRPYERELIHTIRGTGYCIRALL